MGKIFFLFENPIAQSRPLAISMLKNSAILTTGVISRIFGLLTFIFIKLLIKKQTAPKLKNTKAKPNKKSYSLLNPVPTLPKMKIKAKQAEATKKIALRPEIIDATRPSEIRVALNIAVFWKSKLNIKIKT